MLVSEAHERGGEAIGARVLAGGKHGENHRVIARGDVPEVLVVKLRRVRGLVATHCDYRGNNGRHRDGKAEPCDPIHSRACRGAPSVCVVGVLLLLRENGAEHCPRGLWAVGDPGGREGDARLGVLAGADARHGIDHVVPVERKACVQGAVAPGPHVVTTRHGLSARNGQVDGAGNVLRLHVPAVRDKLPIQLTRIRPARGNTIGKVGHVELHRCVTLGRVKLDLQVGAPVRDGVGLVGARAGLREGAGLAVLDNTGIQHLDTHRAPVGAVLPLGNLPVDTMEVPAEVEGSHFGHGKTTRRVQRRVDVRLVHAVVIRMCGSDAKHKSKEHDQERKHEKRRPTAPKDAGGVPVTHRIPQ